MRKVLIVAYYFPPIHTSGVYRSLRFVKYLREFGWEPVVLTIDAVCVHPKDDGLLQDIPENLTIVRTPQVDFYRLVDFAKRNTSFRQAEGNNKIREEAGREKGEGTDSWIKSKLLKIKSQVPVFVRDVFFVPDGAVPWLPLGIASAVKLAKRERVDVLLTTSPPHSTHLVGLVTKKLMGIPWIVDFRDLWIDTFDFYRKPFGKWRKPVEGWMERSVMKHSDHIINVSHGESRHLQEQYKDLPSGKFGVIHNGFDRTDFRTELGGHEAKNGEVLNITHVGTLYPSTGDEYFQVLENLFRRKPRLAERFEFRFVGHIAPEYSETLKTCSFRDRVHMDGPLSHEGAVQATQDSDALLLLQGGDKMGAGEVPGKVFEYMASGRPILAVTWPGDVSSILQESGLGYVVRPDDPECIERTIMELLRLKESSGLRMKPNWSYIESYEGKKLTEKLAATLKTVMEGSRP